MWGGGAAAIWINAGGDSHTEGQLRLTQVRVVAASVCQGVNLLFMHGAP